MAFDPGGLRAGSPAGAGEIPEVAFQNLVGASGALRRTIALGCRVAAHAQSTVLIQGETGTGKELFARGIHGSSEFEGEPFVPINCAALPQSLLESELFGHEKGAFSGAVQTKRGLMEVAGKGTVFLDEIGEMPLELQPKLLRVLEERTIRRVGGLKEIPIECRIVAATNRSLPHEVAEGRFREDLFYRLGVVAIELPPLREREGDIELLARVFLDVLVQEHGLRPKRMGPGTLAAMRAYHWPGNVRELKNAVEGALVVADGDVILPEHIMVRRRRTVATPLAVDGAPVARAIPIPEGGLPLEAAERQLLEATLEMAGNNLSEAARMMRISRPRLRRMMQAFGITVTRQRAAG